MEPERIENESSDVSASHVDESPCPGDPRTFLSEFVCCIARRAPNGLRLRDERWIVALAFKGRVVWLQNGRIVSDVKGHTDGCTDCEWVSRNDLLTALMDPSVPLLVKDWYKGFVNRSDERPLAQIAADEA
jgi:hypothetical protein